MEPDGPPSLPAAASRGRWLLLGTGAALLLVLGALLWMPFRTARLAHVQGRVEVDGREAVAGVPLPPGTRLRTLDASSGARFEFGDGTRVEAGAYTEIVVGGEGVRLLQGVLAVGEEGTLPIGTPHAEARAYDARLIVSVDPEADETLVKVEQGLARVVRGAEAIEVPAGRYAVASETRSLEALSLPDPQSIRGSPIARILTRGPTPHRRLVVRYDEGTLVYSDRGYRVTSLSEPLRGAFGIGTYNSLGRSTEEEHLVFVANQDVDVFVGIDRRARREPPHRPAFLTDWTPTGWTMHSKDAGDSTFDFYRKSFPKGRIALGGDWHGGDTGAEAHYVVLVAPKGTVR